MKLPLPIRIAVIGAGETSQKIHLPALQSLSREGLFSLVALCDIDRGRAQKVMGQFGFAEYEHDAQKVLTRADIDAVYVFGTAQMHYTYAKEALVHGKHVFVEKPPSIDSVHALEIAALAEDKGLAVMVGFNRRFQESLLIAKKGVTQGSALYSMEALFDKSALTRPVPYGATTWLGGNAIHAIDVFQFIAGSLPIELYSAHNKVAGDVPQNFSALMRWQEGIHAVLRSNNSAGRQTEEYVVHGAGVSFSIKNRDLEKCEGNICTHVHTPDSRGFVEEHRHFASFLSGKDTQLASTMRDGAVALYLTELIEKGHRGPIDWSAFHNRRAHASHDKKERPRVHKESTSSILVLNPAAVAASLPRIAEEHALVYEDQLGSLSHEETQKVVAIITGRGGGPTPKRMLSLLPNLKVIGVVGASVKKYDVEAAVSRGIPVVNASDVYAEAVAEFTLMLMILGLRNASRSHEIMRRGGWGLSLQKGVSAWIRALLEKMRAYTALRFFLPRVRPLWNIVKAVVGMEKKGGKEGGGRGGNVNLKGATIGIVGYGEITKRLIEYLRPFGCSVKVYSEYLKDTEAAERGVVRAELGEVLRSDVVTLHRGLSERTRHSFGRKEINSLKPGAVFINTARGELVDTAALVERLSRGDIFACLDVFEEEPLPRKSPLRRLPNVFLSSHISGSTTQMYADSATSLVTKILGFLKGEKVELITSQTQLSNMT